MSKHNYSQYSKKNYNEPVVEKPIEQMSVLEEVTDSERDFVTTVEAPIEPVEIKMVVEHSETAESVVNESVDTVVLPATVTGTVTNCTKLNVRAKPSTDAEVLTTLSNNSEINIDPARSTSDWLKITTIDGVDGFCMRKFVNAKL